MDNTAHKLAVEMTESELIRAYFNVKNYEGVKATTVAALKNNDTNDSKVALYYQFIMADNRDLLAFAATQGLDHALRNYENYSPLHSAVVEEKMESAKFLIEQGADINATSDDGFNVYSMVAGSNPKMHELLIDAGVKVDKENGLNMAEEAVEYQNPVMTQFFLDKGYSFPKDHLTNTETLMDLLRYQRTDLLNIFIKNGLDLETTLSIYGDDHTLLHASVVMGATKMIPVLIEGGAKTNVVNSSGEPIYQWPINQYKPKTFKVLYENGADPNFSVGEGLRKKTPLLAAASAQRDEMMKILIEQGADLNQTDNDGDTPLHFAAHMGDLELVTLMIEQGADVHKLNRDRKTALDVAKRAENREVAEYLTGVEEKTPNRPRRR